MKPLAWSCLVSALFLASAIQADDKKEEKKDEPIKVVVDQLDKAWGIKFKSVVVKENTAALHTPIKVTLEFTKDVEDPTELKRAFTVFTGVPPDKAPLVFHLFDKDNVSLAKVLVSGLEGDVTGIKGDAIRVVLQCETPLLKQAVKLEARLAVPPTSSKK